MKINKKICGMAAALLANMIFGFSFIFSKFALQFAEPIVILAVRFTAAFASLNILLLLGKIKLNFKGKSKVKLLGMGLAQPLLYFIFELYGLSLVSSALSGVIIALVPVAVMFFSAIFLAERPTAKQVIFTLISIAAVACLSIISNDGSKNHILGIVLLVCAVICAAFFNLLSRSESARFSPFERTYVMFFLSAVGFNVIALFLYGKNYIPSVLSALSQPLFVISIIYLALFSSVAAFMLYNYSTSVISLVQSSSFSNIITVVTVLAGVFILKEKFSVVEYMLCLVIILGVWGVNAADARKSD